MADRTRRKRKKEVRADRRVWMVVDSAGVRLVWADKEHEAMRQVLYGANVLHQSHESWKAAGYPDWFIEGVAYPLTLSIDQKRSNG